MAARGSIGPTTSARAATAVTAACRGGADPHPDQAAADQDGGDDRGDQRGRDHPDHHLRDRRGHPGGRDGEEQARTTPPSAIAGRAVQPAAAATGTATSAAVTAVPETGGGRRASHAAAHTAAAAARPATSADASEPGPGSRADPRRCDGEGEQCAGAEAAAEGRGVVGRRGERVDRVVEDGGGRRRAHRREPQHLPVGDGELVERGRDGQRATRRAGEPPRHRLPAVAARFADELQQHRHEIGDRDVDRQRHVDPGARRQHREPAERATRNQGAPHFSQPKPFRATSSNRPRDRPVAA